MIYTGIQISLRSVIPIPCPDVGTQASYQQLEPNFIGLIFSCFSEAGKTDKVGGQPSSPLVTPSPPPSPVPSPPLPPLFSRSPP